MHIIIDFALVIVGIFILNIGANLLVDGSANIAKALGVRPLLVGLTVVAVGTSAPEFVVSLFAVLSGNLDGMSLGNIVGSNIANIGLILGVSALLGPLAVERKIFKHDLVILGIVTAILIIFAWNGQISRFEGVVLFAGGLAFFWNVISRARNDNNRNGSNGQSSEHSTFSNTLRIIGGLALLIISSRWLIVDHSLPIMKWLGVSDVVIGLTIIAIGTSLPELAAAVASILKNHTEIGVGNVIGSNIINTLIVLGAVASIRDINAQLNYQLCVQAGMTLMLYPLFKYSKYQKLTGAILLVGFVSFIIWEYLR